MTKLTEFPQWFLEREDSLNLVQLLAPFLDKIEEEEENVSDVFSQPFLACIVRRGRSGMSEIVTAQTRAEFEDILSKGVQDGTIKMDYIRFVRDQNGYRTLIARVGLIEEESNE